MNQSKIRDILGQVFGANVPSYSIDESGYVQIHDAPIELKDMFDRIYEAAKFLDSHPKAPETWRKGLKEF